MYTCIGLDVYIGGIYTEFVVIGELTNLILVIGELSEVYIPPPPPGGGGALSIYTGGGVPQHIQKGGS